MYNRISFYASTTEWDPVSLFSSWTHVSFLSTDLVFSMYEMLCVSHADLHSFKNERKYREVLLIAGRRNRFWGGLAKRWTMMPVHSSHVTPEFSLSSSRRCRCQLSHWVELRNWHKSTSHNYIYDDHNEQTRRWQSKRCETQLSQCNQIAFK